MLDTIFSIFWGIILVLSIISVPYIIIKYEINRRQDKKKEEQGIYIRRVNRFASLIRSSLLLRIWPAVMVEV